jgi:hypothetical protein
MAIATRARASTIRNTWCRCGSSVVMPSSVASWPLTAWDDTTGCQAYEKPDEHSQGRQLETTGVAPLKATLRRFSVSHTAVAPLALRAAARQR